MILPFTKIGFPDTSFPDKRRTEKQRALNFAVPDRFPATLYRVAHA
jgi:hypothetical protein